MADLVVVNCGEVATCDGSDGGVGAIADGAVVVDSGKVTWVGSMKDFRRKALGKPRKEIDARGMLVTPGFIDPHTHLAFAGSREDELEKKALGKTYLEILDEGGGIARTIDSTRRAPEGQVLGESGQRISQLVRNGVTTVEVKTGYGQRLKDELKLLRVIRKMDRTWGAEVVPTFLGLHAKPTEFKDADEFVRYAIGTMLPGVAASPMKPEFSDCFCEDGVFSKEQCRKYLAASKRLGFRLKIHADEFHESGGAGLAAEAGCVSADHLGMASQDGVKRMGRKGVTAVLLPGTSLYSSIPYAHAKEIMHLGCRVALGTDLSPNSWVESPQVVMGLACTALRMTPGQALLGFTRNAADAIGRSDIGSITPGNKADLVIHRVKSHRDLPYRMGGNYVDMVIKEGKEIFRAPAA